MTDPMKREIERAIHDAEHPSGMSTHDGMARISAATLRRLHEAHDWQYKMAGERLRRIEKLEAQRDALLEALKELMEYAGIIEERCDAVATNKARAAIKMVEEGK